jgi:N-acetylmuramoyl-L-alanine amidase
MAEDYEVRAGDCMSSIASERGFFWETLWNHSKNAELKRKRGDPNILKEGDVVFIPDLEVREEPRATEQTHRFRLKGEPAKLKIRLMKPKEEKEEQDDDAPASSSASPLGGLGGAVPGLPATGGADDDSSDLADPDYVPPKEEEEPIADADYVLEVDGVWVAKGKTDGDGRLQIALPPRARVGRLVVYPGLPEERIITLDLGAMDPVEEVSGVRKRLRNLGYLCDPEGPGDAADLQQAVRRFQEKNDLTVTGSVDAATRSKLKDLHGS